MNNKKGLSDVVTTVLIILLVLAAIVIIWTFIRPALINTGKRIDASCIQATVIPVSCTSTATEASVKVQREAGSSVDIIRVIAIAGNDRGDAVYTASTGDADFPDPLEAYVYTIGTPGGVAAKTASATAVIKTSAGEEITCPEYKPRITCT